MRELLKIRRRSSTMSPTPLAIFLEEERKRLGLTWTEIEELTGEADSNIERLRKGQEAKPSQLSKIAKAFDRPVWYVFQRAGISPELPGEPSAEARRLGVAFAGNADLLLLADLISRLSLDDRATILRLVRSMLGEDPDQPKKKTPGPRRKR